MNNAQTRATLSTLADIAGGELGDKIAAFLAPEPLTDTPELEVVDPQGRGFYDTSHLNF